MASNNVYLASKPRYDVLDGLRGVAAMTVVIFHLFETYNLEGCQQTINHGYLAVEFFFVLSGFVIGYAYDDRWDRMTLASFIKRRLTRLHPMLVIGTVVGACLFFFGAGAFPLVLQSDMWMILACFLLCLLMIPCPTSMDIRGWQEINSFNGASWSLTFEYVANILYAIFLRHLPKVAIAILSILALIPLLDLTLGLDLFGFFSDGPQYHVKGGWSLTPLQVYIGFARLLYPFLCGLLISRCLSVKPDSGMIFSLAKHHLSLPKIKGGFWWASLILVFLLSMPCVSGVDGVANGLYQFVCIVVAFPLIVLIGASSVTTDARSSRVCKFLGDISYPLYITHYPLIYAQMSFAYSYSDAPLWVHVMMSGGVFVFAVIMAYALLKAVDLPVRHWLTENWLKKS